MKFPGTDNLTRWGLLSLRPWLFRSWKTFGIAMAFLALVPGGVILMVATSKARERIERQSFRELNTWASLLARQINEEFGGLTRYVESFASRPALIGAISVDSVEGVRTHLAAMVENNLKISRAVFTDSSGTLLTAFPNDPTVVNKSFAQREWFQRAIVQRNAFVSGAYRRAAFEKEEVVAIACAVRSANGDVLGVITAQYLLSDLNVWLDRLLRETPIQIVVADRHGNPVCDRDELFSALKAEASAGQESPPAETFNFRFNGQKRMVTRVWLPEIEWTLFLLLPQTVALRPVKEIQEVILLFSTVAFSIFVIVAAVWIQTLFRYAEGLERSNQQLEYFCYSIAHNFRAPMRAINGFAEFLRERVPNDGEAIGYLNKIRESADKLDELVADLLLFGKVSHLDVKLERVEIATAIEAAVDDIKSEIEDRKAEVRLEGAFDAATADENLLRHALKELLCNAVKFVPPERQPRVRVVGERIGNVMRIWVHDNGLGIEPAHASQIYEAFHKLLPESPGTGVGLSIARTAAERMGGRIGFTSLPGEGTSFWLCIPRA